MDKQTFIDRCKQAIKEAKLPGGCLYVINPETNDHPDFDEEVIEPCCVVGQFLAASNFNMNKFRGGYNATAFRLLRLNTEFDLSFINGDQERILSKLQSVWDSPKSEPIAKRRIRMLRVLEEEYEQVNV